MKLPIHIVTVIIVLKYKSKYLLVQRSKEDEIFPSKWQNLGGKVEIGESLEDAISREVKEEVGIYLDKMISPIFIQSYSWEKEKKSIRRMGIIFLFKLETKPEIKLGHELQNHGWFTFKEAKRLQSIGMDSKTGTLGQLKVAEEIKLLKINRFE